MSEVRFDQATKLYAGNDEAAVDALDLEIRDGELMVLVGPSGSGKSTALRMLAGLEEVDGGAVWIGQDDRHRHPGQEPRRGDDLPELRAVPLTSTSPPTSPSR